MKIPANGVNLADMFVLSKDEGRELRQSEFRVLAFQTSWCRRILALMMRYLLSSLTSAVEFSLQ